MQLLYKIRPAAEWAKAEATGIFTGSGIDHAHGFIHLSTAHQVRKTARRHYAGGKDLALVAFPEEDLNGPKWEPSRGGGRFPHDHGMIPVRAAHWVRPLPFEEGIHVFHHGIPQ